MSDAVNEISKSLDSLEESIKNVQEEQKNGKLSLKAFEDKVEELGNKQLELSKSLADVTQALDKNTKALNATNEVKSLGQKVASHEVVKNYQHGTSAVFTISTKADTINKSPAANSITRNTITPAYQAGMVTMPDQPLQIEQLIPHFPVSVDAIEYAKEGTVTDGSKVTAEGEKLGETIITKPSLHTTNCVNIGAYTVVTHQLLTNEAALAAFIEIKMQYKLRLKVENQLINGDGTDVQLAGLLHEGNFTDKTSIVQSKLEKDATMFDFAMWLKTEFENQYIVPEHLLLSPDDWTKLALMKDANGRYILGGPQILTSKNVWGLPVMTTPFLKTGKYILGNFTLGATIHDREALDFRISDSDGENFKSMLYTFRVNRRLAFTVENPLAIFAGDWSLPS
jgi:HK97 family phage major capsid protein